LKAVVGVKIGQLAKLSGLAPSRIRFYEKIGLLQTVERQPNGYRTYPPEAALILDLITRAQKAGFRLDEIRALLTADMTRWDHDALLETIRRKVADIEAMEVRLTRSKAYLVALVHEIEARPDNIDCAANARRVLSKLLDGTLGSAAMEGGDVKVLDKAGGA
jgi:DNA-binding transcriptional MerR regulator